MIALFAVLAYTGILLAALVLLLIADILATAAPQATMLPFVALLLVSLALPMIASRGGK